MNNFTQQTKLSKNNAALLNSIDDFEAPYLEEKLFQNGVFETHENYLEAFTELKRYLYISSRCKNPIEMVSEIVDKVWHQFILFTPQYHDFCNQYLGTFIHHVPITTYTPMEKNTANTFKTIYRKLFGELPKIWDYHDGHDFGTAPPD